MWTRSALPALLVTFGALVDVGCSYRVETFVIDAAADHGWVTIEHSNPSCPERGSTFLMDTIVVPASRYMCTSSPIYKGWMYQRYYQVRPDGERTSLDIGTWIHMRKSFEYRQSGELCHIVGVDFFFGTSEELKADSPHLKDRSFFSQHHPECLSDPSEHPSHET